ncbi:bifunctional 4-alpha-glucanotransferase/amylo-alpha-1,6-glucosidase [Tilletia horrida]|nr:bifunctional 4-alpha-glucanotransferase/amylo-alpha-1,6-glucosidase [Tilletia horrida]
MPARSKPARVSPPPQQPSPASAPASNNGRARNASPPSTVSAKTTSTPSVAQLKAAAARQQNGAAAAPQQRAASNATPKVAPAPAKVSAPETPITVHELKLEEDGSPAASKSYVRLPAPYPHPYVLRFTIDAGTIASRDGVLYTNFPGAEAKGVFKRDKFYAHPLPTDVSKPVHVDLFVTSAGAFEFYVEHAAPEPPIPYPTVEQPLAPRVSAEERAKKRVQGKHGYFNVDPILRLPGRESILDAKTLAPRSKAQGGGKLGKEVVLTQDGIVLQSFISKWAGGPLPTWAPHLDSARDAGYNMLHFPPLNVRGASDSPYSIANQTDFAPDLFEKGSKAAQSRQGRIQEVAKWIAKFRDEWGLLSMTDVVLNHTASDSEWLNEHPDAGYNPLNSPHLTGAAELDEALHKFSADLASLGLPTEIKSAADADAIVNGMKQHVYEPLKLWQYYVVDVEANKAQLADAWDGEQVQGSEELQNELQGKNLGDAAALLEKHALKNRLILGERFATRLDIPTAVRILRTLADAEGKGKDDAIQAAGAALDKINAPLYAVFDEDVKAGLDNLGGRLRYQRLDDNGPKLGPISEASPLAESYFTRLDPKHPAAAKHDKKALHLANNGWIWAADPLMDFASPKSRVYMRREVIAWGDCVKLRYGTGPKDSPFLWSHMEQYTRMLAKMFAGFRIDNCHSTPIHVGEYFLDVARQENPDLYVCAELFTGSSEMDEYFVSRLGINSLIREMENGHDPKEESRLLYRFGVNKPIGSMDKDCLSFKDSVRIPGEGQQQDVEALVVPHPGSSPHALFMDVTHDNETPTSKRTTEDAITMGALVAFSWSAIGSNKGFDDLYPKLLDVVGEKRAYATAPVDSGDKAGESFGISEVKRVVNHLHAEMVAGGFSEGHVHQENDYLIMHRVHPQTHQGYICVAHTAFHSPGRQERGQINPIRLNRTKVQYIMGKTLQVTERTLQEDAKTLRGLPSKLVDVPCPHIEEGREDGSDALAYSEIIVPDVFPPGSIMLFATRMDGLSASLDELCLTGAEQAMAELDLTDLNVVLYRADGEERDVSDGQDGTYEIPGHGKLVYCGLEGWMHPLRSIVNSNDLGHPVCAHLRDGTWPLDYVQGRLEKQTERFPHLAAPAAWFKERFDAIKTTVPSFMRPKYFALVVNEAYKAATARAHAHMSDFVKSGHDFTKALALCSVQMNGVVKSASLWPDKESASMAAGLPFFSAGWARCWGRDVFISLRGLYLTTGMSQYAREHILSFGSTLKHGLIPNLLDSTRTPRYNCRDGPWFFAQNVQDYCTMVENGEAILQEKVKRRFPANDEWVAWDDAKAFAYESTVAELIQEILQRHATGIHFREYNAGPAIDGCMKDAGFNIDIDVDWSTGILFGGNEHNCGTWQDKMGSSAKAGNRGVPGTPRDGAAVEITGLLKSTLRWVDGLAAKGKWPAKGVEATLKEGGQPELVTYKQWGELIQKNFEKCYYVPLDPAQDKDYHVDPALINRRGIYKDVFGTGKGREWSDYQLRANFPIAMSVAPELFDPAHALSALQAASHVLRDVLGMRTLDPSDMTFRPVYDNSNDSDDFTMGQGFSYHRGPPWVWPLGFFLRAYLNFDRQVNGGASKEQTMETFHFISNQLLEHRRHIKESAWAGLPELTNDQGAFCGDSCPTQAWSASTLLDVLEEMHQIQKRARVEGDAASTGKANGSNGAANGRPKGQA